MTKNPFRAPALLLSMALSALAVGCSSPTGTSISTAKVTIRSLPSDFFTRRAVAYEGYRTTSGPGTGSGVPTKANIDQDLLLMKEAGYTLLRLYSSNTDGQASLVLQEIQALGYDMKVQLGIWISGSKVADDGVNQVEIAKGISLANQYPSIVEAVSVGNETMVSWSSLAVPVLDMKGYIAQVRNAIAQPVTTDDDWAFYADSNGTATGGAGSGAYGTASILASIDYISFHSYPFSEAAYSLWNWQQTSAGTTVTGTSPAPRATAMMNASLAWAQSNYSAVQGYAAGQGYGGLPIVIGETGWKAVATNGNSAPCEYDMAHPVNQKLYIEELASWTTGPKNIFYFEAFDEPWKGSDDGWGLFDVNRLARYDLYGVAALSGSLESGSPSNLTYTDANALFYVAQATNGTVAAGTYLAFADNLTAVSGTSPAGTAIPVGGTAWYGWNSPATAYGGTGSGASVPNGDSGYEKITTAPESWGWGFFLDLTNADDLSNFPGGHLNFYLRTKYPGKLHVGYATGSVQDGTNGDAYTSVASGDGSGYVNDGAWHLVKLSVASISGWVKDGSSATSAPKLSQVIYPFVVSDVFATTAGSYAGTGNTQAATTGQEIDVDDIYWTQF